MCSPHKTKSLIFKIGQAKAPYHSPPQGISVAGEARLAFFINSIFFRQVHKVGGEDEAEEANVKGGDQFLGDKKIPQHRLN